MDIAIKKILVPVDLGELSFSALRHAAALAAKNGATIHLLHVINYSSFGLFNPHKVFFSSPFANKETREARMKILVRWKNTLEAEYDIKIILSMQEGSLVHQINKYADAQGIDFIVLGISESRNWLKKLIGSTARHITTSSKIPVITILHGALAIFHWQNVVIPVSNCIPEKRINAILNFAVEHKIKIHFVSIADKTEKIKAEKFHLLLESLKLVKTFGNITV